jgi:hypothetical protein
MKDKGINNTKNSSFCGEPEKSGILISKMEYP